MTVKARVRWLFQLGVATAVFVVAQPAFADLVSIAPSSKTVTLGQTFTLDIAATVTDLYAFQFDLGYDPTVLSANSIVEGSLLPSGGSTFYIPGFIDNVGGTISGTADSLISAVPGVTGTGVLARVNFTALNT